MRSVAPPNSLRRRAAQMASGGSDRTSRIGRDRGRIVRRGQVRRCRRPSEHHRGFDRSDGRPPFGVGRRRHIAGCGAAIRAGPGRRRRASRLAERGRCLDSSKLGRRRLDSRRDRRQIHIQGPRRGPRNRRALGHGGGWRVGRRRCPRSQCLASKPRPHRRARCGHRRARQRRPQPAATGATTAA